MRKHLSLFFLFAFLGTLNVQAAVSCQAIVVTESTGVLLQRLSSVTRIIRSQINSGVAYESIQIPTSLVESDVKEAVSLLETRLSQLPKEATIFKYSGGQFHLPDQKLIHLLKEKLSGWLRPKNNSYVELLNLQTVVSFALSNQPSSTSRFKIHHLGIAKSISFNLKGEHIWNLDNPKFLGGSPLSLWKRAQYFIPVYSFRFLQATDYADFWDRGIALIGYTAEPIVSFDGVNETSIILSWHDWIAHLGRVQLSREKWISFILLRRQIVKEIIQSEKTETEKLGLRLALYLATHETYSFSKQAMILFFETSSIPYQRSLIKNQIASLATEYNVDPSLIEKSLTEILDLPVFKKPN